MRIAEVVEEYGLSADTLRYYERIGLLRPVRRNASGVRDYGEEDCARISFVKCMRGANVSIEALIEHMQLFDEGRSRRASRSSSSSAMPRANASGSYRRDSTAWTIRSPTTTS